MGWQAFALVGAALARDVPAGARRRVIEARGIDDSPFRSPDGGETTDDGERSVFVGEVEPSVSP